MSESNGAKAEYLLRKAATMDGGDLALEHMWVWEGERWNELVFALLTRVADLPEDDVRGLIEQMSDLDLLEIASLSSIRKKSGGLDLKDAHTQRALELLQEGGFGQEEAQRGLTAVCDAAAGLQEFHGAKVQRYLRSYGEMMLAEIERFFQFSSLDDDEVRLAFTYWLQNVLNMPLSLLDENLQKFSAEQGLKPDELIAAADALDLNLGLLDDLVLSYMNRD